MAGRYTVGRPRLLQSLLPRLTLRRGAKAVIQAQALGVSELYLGVQVRIYRMDIFFVYSVFVGACLRWWVIESLFCQLWQLESDIVGQRLGPGALVII